METTRTDDVRKAVHTAREQVRTSLLAALGAGNLAGEAVADAVSKARERVTESSESARRNIEELPGELEQLRDRLDPAELRKLLDEYTDSALRLYRRLAESGEQTWDRLSEQPQVRQAVEQLEEALHSAQERMDDVTSDTRERVDEMVSRL
ncbi:membrane protein, partial [Saccharomonospora iraqiensis]|uniref:membrane protein n=1 Tax=Saccharomonospora iraqiensis TaxID=52698 RepID=UPI000555A48E